MAITQQSPSAWPGQRYSSFAGRVAAVQEEFFVGGFWQQPQRKVRAIVAVYAEPVAAIRADERALSRFHSRRETIRSVRQRFLAENTQETSRG
jgi:hypothetical protein